MMRTCFLGIAMLAGVWTSGSAAAEPAVVALTEVRAHVDREVAVEFVVASSRLLETGALCFLNSKRNFSDDDNFTIVIDREGLKAFAEQGVADPAAHFRDQRVRVTGKVTLHKDKPQIVVSRPAQLAQVIVDR